MSFKHFTAILIMRNKEFLRDRSSLAWNILMPVLIITGFAFAFSGDIDNQYKVAVINQNLAKKPAGDFLQLQYIDFYNIDNTKESIDKSINAVRHHQTDLLLDAKNLRYWVNTESPKGYFLEKILKQTGYRRSENDLPDSTASDTYTKQAVHGRAVRYLDWVIPGILSMNIMFSALFGVGFVIVRYRKNGMLKRLKATPLTAFEYLSAQVASRMILIMCVTIVIFYGTHLFVDFLINGSQLLLMLVFALGALSMISLGLLIAARLKSEETAGGLLNLLSWPMMFLSGVWFSLEGATPAMQYMADIFPLTHVISAARLIMIDGAGLSDISNHVLVLLLESGIFMSIGAYFFKWD